MRYEERITCEIKIDSRLGVESHLSLVSPLASKHQKSLQKIGAGHVLFLDSLETNYLIVQLFKHAGASTEHIRYLILNLRCVLQGISIVLHKLNSSTMSSTELLLRVKIS